MYIYDDSSSEYFQSLHQAKIYLHSKVRNSLFGKNTQRMVRSQTGIIH